MSEQEATPSTEPTKGTAPDPQNEPQGEPDGEVLGEGGKKALAAEREARKAAEKAAADLTAKLKEIESANLSDLEKAQNAAKEYEAAAAKAATEALRWRTAAKFGISDEDAETFLTGADEATITKQAERLAAFQKAPTTPRPDPSQGAKGTPKPTDPAHAFAAWAEGRI